LCLKNSSRDREGEGEGEGRGLEAPHFIKFSRKELPIIGFDFHIIHVDLPARVFSAEAKPHTLKNKLTTIDSKLPSLFVCMKGSLV